ncbi:MAG TPA: tetrahydrofolate dehydrogenase/cyclohydrolase catalytic domain-containing protein [Dehalococcoidales bacterium]|nr:tetrahydrofolate dehydrogenase/cyclohydrolase catalytic domain-containing protein [Dehalococcoidales bacterium]
MTASLIKGAEVAAQIREELKKEIADLISKHNLVPGLATVLVGADPASQVYVGQKEKTCKELGMYSERHDIPENSTQAEVVALVEKLNKNPKIHGILCQLPLPKHLNEEDLIYHIDPKKDVDGLHPVNQGKLMIGEADFIPCTPRGIQQLLIRSNTQIEGADVVVIGRSNLVGKPILNILLQKAPGANATVTLCHTKTKDLAFYTKHADIIIAAAGKPKTVTGDMVKPGCTIIDVGVNEIGKTAEGKRILVGDVDFEGVKDKARAITPVPGGVGPMTITMLMMNTVKAAKLAAGIK